MFLSLLFTTSRVLRNTIFNGIIVQDCSHSANIPHTSAREIMFRQSPAKTTGHPIIMTFLPPHAFVSTLRRETQTYSVYFTPGCIEVEYTAVRRRAAFYSSCHQKSTQTNSASTMATRRSSRLGTF